MTRLYSRKRSARSARRAKLGPAPRPLHRTERKRAAGTFTFAQLGENEEDLTEREAWYAKVHRLDSVLRQRRWFIRVKEVDKAILGSWLVAAQRLKEKTYTLYLAYRNLRTPAHARNFVALLVGYVFSLIDAIPNFILVVGLLDETVVLPLGVNMARKLIPGEVLARCRERMRQVMREGKKLVSRAAAVVRVAVRVLLATLGGVFAFHIAQRVGT